LTHPFAGKVWKDCEDCQRLLNEFDEDEVCQCDRCLHLFHYGEVVWIPNRENPEEGEECYCDSCYINSEIRGMRCCATCKFLEWSDELNGYTCEEGGFSEIGDVWKILTEEECNSWEPKP